jgi:hypothetical protein
MQDKMPFTPGTRFRFLPLFVLLILKPFLWAQVPDDARLLVGMKLAELITRFGPPQSVYAARGQEPWQDDVVFTYGAGDFYVVKDRVWQVGLKSAYSVSLGDPRQAVLLALGEGALDQGDHVLLPLPDNGWQLMLRVNLNPAGRVSAIFIYRPDF